MSFKRLWAIFISRNREFFRDKAAFGWNLLFPFLLIGGFAIIFGGDERKEFKVGVFPCASIQSESSTPKDRCVPDKLDGIEQIHYIAFQTAEEGLDKLKHHKIDLLLAANRTPLQYWMSDTAPKGYIVEKMIMGQLNDRAGEVMARQEMVSTRQIRYIDWFFPGIVGMNIMFSALYGVGFVVVRYRKNGVLKRLKATPLTAFEYLSAQMLSRLFVIAVSMTILWIGCDLIFDFHVEGAYVDLAVIFMIGNLSLTSLGLIIASRGTSEEFANGALNFITWPMMFLSEVWFSLEGAPRWVRMVSDSLPLTHLLAGARKIMNDGATLADVRLELFVLVGFTAIFLVVGASLFSWNR